MWNLNTKNIRYHLLRWLHIEIYVTTWEIWSINKACLINKWRLWERPRPHGLLQMKVVIRNNWSLIMPRIQLATLILHTRSPYTSLGIMVPGIRAWRRLETPIYWWSKALYCSVAIGFYQLSFRSHKWSRVKLICISWDRHVWHRNHSMKNWCDSWLMIGKGYGKWRHAIWAVLGTCSVIMNVCRPTRWLQITTSMQLLLLNCRLEDQKKLSSKMLNADYQRQCICSANIMEQSTKVAFIWKWLILPRLMVWNNWDKQAASVQGGISPRQFTDS